MAKDDERADGWFEKYVLDSFKGLNTSVSKLESSVSKIHERIDKIHKAPCADVVRLGTSMGFMKWVLAIVGLSFLTVIGLLITLLRMVADYQQVVNSLSTAG